MHEFAPKSPFLHYDEAWLYMATCTHNDKYDWKGVRHRDDVIITDYVRIYVTPWRRKDDKTCK